MHALSGQAQGKAARAAGCGRVPESGSSRPRTEPAPVPAGRGTAPQRRPTWHRTRVAPGWLPDGSRNRLMIRRLKDKCGNRSNASCEVEFRDLHAVMLGEGGRGLRTILEMGHLTRLECAIGSAAPVRQSVSQAIHHVSNRQAFERVRRHLRVRGDVLGNCPIRSCRGIAP